MNIKKTFDDYNLVIKKFMSTLSDYKERLIKKINESDDELLDEKVLYRTRNYGRFIPDRNGKEILFEKIKGNPFLEDTVYCFNNDDLDVFSKIETDNTLKVYGYTESGMRNDESENEIYLPVDLIEAEDGEYDILLDELVNLRFADMLEELKLLTPIKLKTAEEKAQEKIASEKALLKELKDKYPEE